MAAAPSEEARGRLGAARSLYQHTFGGEFLVRGAPRATETEAPSRPAREESGEESGA